MPNSAHTSRLALTLATTTVLLLVSSCSSFKTAPTSSIYIQPSAPFVALNTPDQLALQAWAIDNKGNKKQLTSGVTWRSFSPSVLTIDSTTGVPNGVSLGTTTVTASAGGFDATATATVFLSGVTAIAVTPTTATVSTSGSSSASFTAQATTDTTSMDITSGATWSITPTTTDITCTFTSPNEVCTADANATAGAYTLTVTYVGTNETGTATLNVTE